MCLGVPIALGDDLAQSADQYGHLQQNARSPLRALGQPGVHRRLLTALITTYIAPHPKQHLLPYHSSPPNFWPVGDYITQCQRQKASHFTLKSQMGVVASWP